MKETKWICDICEREILPQAYYIKVKPFYFMQGRSGNRREWQEDFEWCICADCLAEIGKRVSEKTNVDFQVEVGK